MKMFHSFKRKANMKQT